MKYIIILFLIFSSCSRSSTVSKDTNYVDTNKLYTMFEVNRMPMFPGGNDSIISYINSHHKELNEIYKISYDGSICLSFIIDKYGTLKNFEVKGTDPFGLFSKHFGIIFTNMPKWEPGRINDNKVNTIFCYPYLFKMK